MFKQNSIQTHHLTYPLAHLKDIYLWQVCSNKHLQEEAQQDVLTTTIIKNIPSNYHGFKERC